MISQESTSKDVKHFGNVVVVGRVVPNCILSWHPSNKQLKMETDSL